VPVIDGAAWASRLLIAVVFGLSAWGKLADRPAARKAVAEFGVPPGWVTAIGWALPVTEAAVAITVLVPWTAMWSAAVALVLLAVFTAAVARSLARGERPVCSCFGAISATPVSSWTIVRNAVLMVLAALTAWGAVARPRVPAGLPGDRGAGLAVAAVLTGALVWQGGQVRGLRRRVDEQAAATLGPEGVPVGAVAPEFSLPDTTGGRTSLEKLLADGRRVLLVFVHPSCELCAALARELPRWRERTAKELTIVVISNGSVQENIAWGREQQLGDIALMVQEGNEASLRYRIRGTPSAVLIDADGRIAAAVARGAIAVRELLAAARVPARAR
jgi:methylamine dehydrogenase accessory protein MauD